MRFARLAPPSTGRYRLARASEATPTLRVERTLEGAWGQIGES